MKNFGKKECRFPQRDDSKRSLAANGAMLRGYAGRPARLSGITRNIPERKRFSDTIQQLNADLSATLTAIPDLLFELDHRGTYINIWAQNPNLLARQKEVLLGRTVAEMLAPDAAETVMTAISEADRKGASFGKIICLDLSTGQKWFELSTSKKSVVKGKVHFMMLSRDVTERKHLEEKLRVSESRYRNIVETTNEGIWSMDSERRTTFVNEALLHMLGYTRKEMTGALVDNFILDEELVDHDREMALRRKRENSKYERSLRRKDGSICSVLVSATALVDTEGRFAGSFAMITDITKIKKAEEELNKYREYLEDLVKKRTEDAMKAMHLASIGELAAGVAHEINNPINGIINYARLMTNKLNQTSVGNEIPLRIIKEGNRIATIVEGLLSFGRELGHEKKVSIVGEIIHEVLNLTRSQLRMDNIRLDVDLAEPMPVITANAQQLQQVFMNLISNARYALNLKYEGAHKDKRLEILGGMCASGNKPCVRLSFTDYGIGIPSDILEKVTSPFFSTKPTGHGTGLGLSISNGIIKEHGGILSVESMEGAWTRVIIDLPV